MIAKQRHALLFSGVGSLAAIVGISATVTLTTISNTPVSASQLVARADSSPLAKQLQGKPVVVDIYATWCPGCKNIAPTLSQLKQKYKDTAHFVVLDVTDKNTTQASAAKAKQLGLSSFFNANKSQTSTVAIIDPATGKILQQFRNNPQQADYEAVLNSAIAKMKGSV